MNLTPEKINSILKGAAIAAAGAALTYATQYVTGNDFGAATPVVVAILSILVNALHKYTTPDAPAPTTPADAKTGTNGQP